MYRNNCAQGDALVSLFRIYDLVITLCKSVRKNNYQYYLVFQLYAALIGYRLPLIEITVPVQNFVLKLSPEVLWENIAPE